MDSTNEAFASLQLDVGAAEFSGGESNENRHKHKKNPEHEDETDILHGPETSVFMEDGLFVRIASFCDSKELLRICTLTKSDMQRKCELVLRGGGIKKDPRRDEPVSETESWVQVLRGRIALDKDLVFTVGDPLIMEHQITKLELEKQVGMFPKSVYFSTPGETIPEYNWSGVICGRAEQAMRKGVHRAIFTTANGYSRIGILGAFVLQGKLTRRKY